MSVKEIAASVKKYNNFLVSAHTNPEGDALGAELAFCHLLEKLGKNVRLVNEDSVPIEYSFMPGLKKIEQLKRRSHSKINFGCFVVLDCSDITRTGEVYRLNKNNKPVLNIDHHISNTRFGDLNWVDPVYSSCSEMIYRLYKELKVPFDQKSALYLYIGILTDTGSFRYSNTTSSTHRAVAELLEYDVNVVQCYRDIYENLPFKDMQFLAKVLPGIKREAGGRIVWFQIPAKYLRNGKISFDLTDNVLSFARSIKGVEVAVLFRENIGVKDEIRVNLRSQGRVDVNKIASFFGGGGHKAASGITMQGKINSVRQKVLRRIKKAIGKYQI